MTVAEKKIKVEYGKIPNGVIDGFDGITFYLETRFVESKEEHEAAVDPYIKRMISVNDYGYKSWEETKRKIVVWTTVSQVTVVSFRVRDSY